MRAGVGMMIGMPGTVERRGFVVEFFVKEYRVWLARLRCLVFPSIFRLSGWLRIMFWTLCVRLLSCMVSPRLRLVR